MKNDPNVTWGIVKAILNGEETNIIVIEYERGVFKEYWVKLGGLINAIYKPHSYGLEIVGVGAKKYRKEIIDVVDRYQLSKMVSECLNDESIENEIEVEIENGIKLH